MAMMGLVKVIVVRAEFKESVGAEYTYKVNKASVRVAIIMVRFEMLSLSTVGGSITVSCSMCCLLVV